VPMDLHRYPPAWKVISLRIREREVWRCKFCAAAQGEAHPDTGSRVILTVAHLGVRHPDGRPGNPHDKLDVRDENLAALCQRCHLKYDRHEHNLNAAYTRWRKKVQAGQLYFLEMETRPARIDRQESMYKKLFPIPANNSPTAGGVSHG